MEVKARIKSIKIDKNDKALIAIIQRAMWFFAGAVLCFSNIIGEGCAFSISLISIANRRNFIFTALGACLGYALFCDGADAVRYLIAAAITMLGRLIILLVSDKDEVELSMLLSFLTVLSSGAAMCLRLGSRLGMYALVLGEAILSAGASYFFFRAVHSKFKRLKYLELPNSDVLCILISGSILLSSLCSISIKGFVPARLLAVLCMLIATRFATPKWGISISLALGFAIGINGEGNLFLLGAYAFSSLVSGMFYNMPSLYIATSFILSMTFFAASVEFTPTSIYAVIESLVAGVILVLLPRGIKDELTRIFEGTINPCPDGSLRQSLVVRLRFAASALSQVSESVRDVRERISQINHDTSPESELRMVAADQFFSISDMLEDLAFEFSEAEHFDYRSAGEIRRMLAEYDIYPDNISVIIDSFDRLRLEILAPSKTRGLSNPRLHAQLESICKRRLDSLEYNYCGSSVMLSIVEKANYKMDYGFAQYSAEGSLCGDTIKLMSDGKGHMIFIISDGMGRGKRAALDGAMGAGLLAKLLTAGFGFDSSLKVVNSALLVKSSDESLTTLDCVCVDMFNGRCEFYKAGAPKSYILKQSSLSKCELSSMPVGILRDTQFAKRTTVLGIGDEVILMSDGITDLDESLLERCILDNRDLSPNEKANMILNFAIENGDIRHLDDMSIIVARLIE